MKVVPRAEGWALMVDDLETPAWVVDSRERAVDAARDAARFHEARLVVKDRKGDVQREMNFS